MNNKITDSLSVVITVAAYCLLCFVTPVLYPNMFSAAGKKIEVTVTGGMSARDAARAIKEAGIVTNSESLVRWMVKYGIDRTLKPGVYELTAGDAISVAREMKNIKPRAKSVTIIPGARYRDVLRALYTTDDKEESLNTALADDANFPESMRPLLPENPRDRIIFLLPETYFLAPGDAAAEKLVRRASNLWFERVGKGIDKQMDKKYLLERGILASLVEGEAKIADERPVLAGIFLSRINKRMRLQSCASVIYCWEQMGEKKRRLTYNDLKIDSLYNTYVNYGLPPGPISIPSIGSWESAINPKMTAYLFFFAGKDGRHVFSETYKEHMLRQKEASK